MHAEQRIGRPGGRSNFPLLGWFCLHMQGTYAVKHTTFWMLPPVLVFSLVRFRNDDAGARGNAAFVADKVASTWRAATCSHHSCHASSPPQQPHPQPLSLSLSLSLCI